MDLDDLIPENQYEDEFDENEDIEEEKQSNEGLKQFTPERPLQEVDNPNSRESLDFDNWQQILGEEQKTQEDHFETETACNEVYVWGGNNHI